MLAQVIKQSSNHCSEEGPEFMGIGGKRFILKKWGQDARLELGEVPVSTLVHCRIETELIAKVLKEQAFVIARRFRDGIDARTVEPVLREDLFCRIQDGLARPLRVVGAPPSTSRFIHAYSSSLSNRLVT